MPAVPLHYLSGLTAPFARPTGTVVAGVFKNGDDVLTVKENLGHHSAAFTLNTYGHLTQAMRRDSAARMEKLIQTTVISQNA